MKHSDVATVQRGTITIEVIIVLAIIMCATGCYYYHKSQNTEIREWNSEVFAINEITGIARKYSDSLFSSAYPLLNGRVLDINFLEQNDLSDKFLDDFFKKNFFIRIIPDNNSYFAFLAYRRSQYWDRKKLTYIGRHLHGLAGYFENPTEINGVYKTWFFKGNKSSLGSINSKLMVLLQTVSATTFANNPSRVLPAGNKNMTPPNFLAELNLHFTTKTVWPVGSISPAENSRVTVPSSLYELINTFEQYNEEPNFIKNRILLQRKKYNDKPNGIIQCPGGYAMLYGTYNQTNPTSRFGLAGMQASYGSVVSPAFGQEDRSLPMITKVLLSSFPYDEDKPALATEVNRWRIVPFLDQKSIDPTSNVDIIARCLSLRPL